MTDDEPQTAMLLTDQEWADLVGICRFYAVHFVGRVEAARALQASGGRVYVPAPWDVAVLRVQALVDRIVEAAR